MKFNNNIEIKNLNDLLLLQINERVERALKFIRSSKKVPKTTLDLLKIDAESLKEFSKMSHGESIIFAESLKNTVQFIIKSQETE